MFFQLTILCYNSFYSSGDEVEYNNELEDSTESFENEMNKLRENIERRSNKIL